MHNDLVTLPLAELRQIWAEKWGIEPHAKIGRTMLIKSIEYKIREQAYGELSRDQRQRLKILIASYKRNPRFFDENTKGLKPGTRLIKTWKEKRHTVLVVKHGFEYEERVYTSLSEIAFAITGSRWNGWVFFGLKKQNRKAGSEEEV